MVVSSSILDSFLGFDRLIGASSEEVWDIELEADGVAL
jgi:hypothetical protein